MAKIFGRYILMALAAAPVLTMALKIDHVISLMGTMLAAAIFAAVHGLADKRAAQIRAADDRRERQMTDIVAEQLLNPADDEGDLRPVQLMRELEELRSAVHRVFGQAFETSLAESRQASIWTKGSRTVPPIRLAA